MLTPSQIYIREEILKRLSAGENLMAICREPWAPPAHTVRAWALDDSFGFAQEYIRARQLGYLAKFEELEEIARTPIEGETVTEKTEQTYIHGQPVVGGEVRKTDRTRADMLGHRRLIVDTMKWIVAKGLPKVFGDKQSVEVSGPDGAPLQSQTTATVNFLEMDNKEASQVYQKLMSGN